MNSNEWHTENRTKSQRTEEGHINPETTVAFNQKKTIQQAHTEFDVILG